jgi:hypothetical protein
MTRSNWESLRWAPDEALVLAQRDVGPGASGTITDNFTAGDAFAVVCDGDTQLFPHSGGPFPCAPPLALVARIVVE